MRQRITSVAAVPSAAMLLRFSMEHRTLGILKSAMGVRDSLVVLIVMGSVLGMTTTTTSFTTAVLTRHAEKADSN